MQEDPHEDKTAEAGLSAAAKQAKVLVLLDHVSAQQ